MILGLEKLLIVILLLAMLMIIFIGKQLEKITKLVKRDDMTYDEALEFIDFNIAGAFIGEDTPILVDRMTRAEIKNYIEELD